ncbi:MAG: 4-phosphopantetheinyl transferase [Verrucomicrobiota bacterium]|nr:4-phosphopantetheinyl transferase [Verrucomicrobiota bacterium]
MGSSVPQPIPIGPREVQIWGLWSTASDPVVEEFRSILSLEERRRAERFRFEHLKRSFTLSRGGLRFLLAHYLRCAPSTVELICGPKGKPELRASSLLRFNTSHSGQMTVYAFTLGCELGVDVEHFRKLDDSESIAKRYFSPGEVSDLLTLKAEDKEMGFFRCWTRKEAYVKAIGEGLTVPLDCFQVTLLPETPARFVQIASEMGTAADWSLHHLELAPGYVGALAYRDSPRPVITYPVVPADQLKRVLGEQR